MITRYKHLLELHAAKWGLPTSSKWTFILHNNYNPHYSNINIFWFYNNQRNPLVITKVFPEPSLPSQEHQNLEDAYACASESVPQPFGLYKQEDSWSLWMTGVPGSRLTVDLLSDPAVDSLADTLARIHSGVGSRRGSPAPLDTTRRDDFFDHAIQRSATLAQGCSRIRAGYSRAWLDALPSLPQHGDLYTDNIVVAAGKPWCIVDWETLGLTDLPYYDLITLLLSLAGQAPPSAWSAKLGRFGRRLLDTYSQKLGLHPADRTGLLPFLLARWAYAQRSADRAAAAYSMFENYFSHTAEWERVLLA